MCGRYALSLRPHQIRQRLADAGIQVDEAPPEDDESCRQSYNVPPGYVEPVYRAVMGTFDSSSSTNSTEENGNIKYIIQPMKWGLVPSWTKKPPEYSGLMKTINCRDDSLIENRGLWNSMKHKKRCVVLAEGFFEWQKKSGQKIPHFVKRKDGQLLYMAGLWDCAQFEDSQEKLYTYTVITTSSNPQLKFLHERMPVILEDVAAIQAWLSPERTSWSSELQSLLKPYEKELDCYPVAKEVGKVGNNSETFVIPLDSKENKNNIKNFFGNAKKNAETKPKEEEQVERKEDGREIKVEKEKKKEEEKEEKKEEEKAEKGVTENNAPLPLPKEGSSTAGVKRATAEQDGSPRKQVKVESSPSKKPATRSATSNTPKKKAPIKSDGNKKITSFFGK